MNQFINYIYRLRHFFFFKTFLDQLVPLHSRNLDLVTVRSPSSESSLHHGVHWVRWRHEHRHVVRGRSRLDLDHLDHDGALPQVPQLAVQLTPTAPDTEAGDGDVLAEGALQGGEGCEH